MKAIQSISIYLLVIIVSLSYSYSDTPEFEDKSPLDFYNSVSLIDGDLLDRFIIREVSESFRILPNVSISDSVDSGFLIRGINAEGNGVVEYVDSNEIHIRYELTDDEKLLSFENEVKVYKLTKFKKTNQNTCINLKPVSYTHLTLPTIYSV